MSNDNLPKGEVGCTACDGTGEDKTWGLHCDVCHGTGIENPATPAADEGGGIQYWQRRCKAAEVLIKKYYKNIPDCSEYQDWQDTIDSTPPASAEGGEDYQSRVNDWMQVCFGLEVSKDVTERNHRFIEEALELVQSTGATQSECHQLVDYVFNRRKGEIIQEVGGVMVTLAALCNAIVLNMEDAGEIELKRIWTKVDKIREKQAAKPKHTPLPSHPSPPQQSGMDAVALLKELKQRLLIDIDSDGEPNSSMADLIAMWDKVNVLINSDAIASGQPDKT